MRLLTKTIIVLGIGLAFALIFRASGSLAQSGQTTATPLPNCEYYSLIVSTANVRTCANTSCSIVTQITGVGTAVCTRGEADNNDWLQVDLAPEDPASPIYYLSASVVTPGVNVSPGNTSVCQSYYVADDRTVTAYECASTGCAVVGTLGPEVWTCSQDYSSQYPGWLYIEQSDLDISGWVPSTYMIRGRSVRVAGPTSTGTQTLLPRATATSGTPTVTPAAGTITVASNAPCQTFYVTGETASLRTCAGAGCRTEEIVNRNEELCVRGLIEENPNWLVVDLEPEDTTSALLAVDRNEVAGGTAFEGALSSCEAFSVSSTQSINLRTCPSETCPALATLAPDNWVCVTDYQGEWVYAFVPTLDTFAWISERVVRSMDIDGTPTPSDAPTEVAVQATPSRTGTSAPANTATRTPSPTPPAVGGTAQVITTATATSVPTNTLEGPTATAAPACLPYIVLVVRANVRSCPSTDSQCPTVTQLGQGTPICVLGPVANLETLWFEIDLDTSDATNPITFIAQNLVGPDPSGPTLAPSATVAAEGTIVQTPQASTPTPIFTPVPTSGPIGALLAQEITLAGLRVQNIELVSPLGSNNFRFTLPADWFPDGTNILYLNIDYSEILSTLDVVQGATDLVTFMDVRLDGNLISTIGLDQTTLGEQTIPIILPNNLLADRTRSSHVIETQLRAEGHCLASGESRIFIRNDLSFFHFEFREGVPALDLSLYPRPLFNESFASLTETAIVVLPANPTVADYEAAASVVAGLGLLTGGSLQINVVTADTITPEQALNFNLLLIGQIGTNVLIDDLYARNLLPSQLNNGELTINGEPIEQGDGVIQVISHPDNTKRGIVVVTGQTNDSLAKAAQALGGPQPLLGFSGPIALITDARPVQRPPAGTFINPDLTFADLGSPEIALSGIGSQGTEVVFALPYNQMLADGAFVEVYYTSSEVVQNGRATLSLGLNFTTPLASAFLAGPEIIGTGAFQPAVIRAWIPPDAVIPGEANTLQVEVNISGSWNCDYPSPDIAWITIRGDSYLHLPTRFAGENELRPLVGWFPSPFNNLPDMSDVIIWLPDNPTQLDLQQAYTMVSRLGAATLGGEGFRPHIQIGGVDTLPEGTDLSAYNIIIIGRNTTNSMLAELNQNLKQPFVEGTDQLQQVLDDISYRLQPGLEIGVLQTLISPWSQDRMIMVVSGTGPNGQNYAFDVLASGRFGRADLFGDVVFVAQNSAISVVDTRTLEETTDILTAIVEELPTEIAAQASITPTNNVFVTSTPGPSLTPFPSITPFPSSTASPAFSLTPTPDTPTPLATFEPLPANEAEPETQTAPEWLNLLAIATTAILGIVALAVVIGVIRGRRQTF